MAIVGAMTLARRANIISPDAVVVPGAAVLTKQTLNPSAVGDATPVIANSTAEVEQVLGIDAPHDLEKGDR
jgi:hypothetical protein